jgi:hypothetical protein
VRTAIAFVSSGSSCQLCVNRPDPIESGADNIGERCIAGLDSLLADRACSARKPTIFSPLGPPPATQLSCLASLALEQKRAWPVGHSREAWARGGDGAFDLLICDAAYTPRHHPEPGSVKAPLRAGQRRLSLA